MKNKKIVPKTNLYDFGGMLTNNNVSNTPNQSFVSSTAPTTNSLPYAAVGNILGTAIQGQPNSPNTEGVVQLDKGKTIGGSALKGAGTGAAIGASVGTAVPVIGNVIGTAAGAIIGGVAGAIKGNRKVQDNEEDIRNAQYVNSNYPQYGNNTFKYGGSLEQKQLTSFDEGGTHEENQLGGIPLSQGANGEPNLVEEGETKLNSKDYIFSDSISIDDSIIEAYNLPKSYRDKTFAEASKKIDRPNSRRENDTIEETAKARELEILMNAQEDFKAKSFQEEMSAMQAKYPEQMQALQPPAPTQQGMQEQQMMQDQTAIQDNSSEQQFADGGFLDKPKKANPQVQQGLATYSYAPNDIFQLVASGDLSQEEANNYVNLYQQHQEALNPPQGIESMIQDQNIDPNALPPFARQQTVVNPLTQQATNEVATNVENPSLNSSFREQYIYGGNDPSLFMNQPPITYNGVNYTQDESGNFLTPDGSIVEDDNVLYELQNEVPDESFSEQDLGEETGTPIYDKQGNITGWTPQLDYTQTEDPNFNVTQTPLNAAAQYAPIAYNTAMGISSMFQKPTQLNYEDYINNDQINAPKMNVDPQLRATEQEIAAGQKGIKNIGGAAYLKTIGALANQGAAARAGIYANEENIDNQMQMQADQINMQNKSNNNRFKFSVDDWNARARTAKQQQIGDYFGTAVGQAAQIAQADTGNKLSTMYNNIVAPDFQGKAAYTSVADQYLNRKKKQQ